ncbi:MAG: peptide ABC transporter substrate-binding protein [Anaerolineales bacterium]|nr:MAG: peptide ABC transporter substrate-binding protein [Anaerolineales bacterium]
MLLAACGGATPEPGQPEEPVVEEPVVEEPVVEEPMPEFVPTSLAAPNCDYGGLFEKIEAVDRYTVVFDLCNPFPAFLSTLAFSVFSIYPEEWIAATAGPETRTAEGLDAPVGTGPYRVKEWVRGESLILERNPEYWGEPGIVDTVVFRWSSEGAARLLELQSGTVDGIDNPSPDDFAVIKADSSLQLFERQALNIFYVGITNSFPPFDDIRVRQAVGMGIDRQRIVDNFYPPGSSVASHFTPCVIPNACEGEDWYDFDPAAAKALLADAGYPNGFETTIYYRDVFRSYLPEPGRVAEELQAQFAENMGITANIVVMESGAFIEASGRGELDGVHLLGWNADYPHVTNFLDFHAGRNVLQFGPPYPEVYEQLEAGAQIVDEAEAAPIYAAANDAIKKFVPFVPIAHGGSGVAYRADVVGGHASPLGNEYFAVIDPGGRDTFVWMQNAEPISLFCADETDGESLRPCEQITQALYSYEVAGTATEPGLATSCEPNETLDLWTCVLREGVKFSDGSTFDANDVVATFTMGLDASSPLHVGNTNIWEYYGYLWGLMNVPEE